MTVCSRNLWIYLVLGFVLTGCFDPSVANDSQRSVHSVSSCAIDRLIATTAQEWSVQPEKVVLRGWAFDSISKTVPEVVKVQLASADGTIVKLSHVATRYQRDEVASYYNDTRFLHAGFEAVLDANRLAKGSYRLSIAQYTKTSQMVCETNRVLQVR